MLSPPQPEDVGPFYKWGEIGRIQRWYLQQENKKSLNLNYKLSGSAQMAVLVEVIASEAHVEKLSLRGNALTDDALQLLVNFLATGCSKVTCLDLSDNKLTADAANILSPILKVGDAT